MSSPHSSRFVSVRLAVAAFSLASLLTAPCALAQGGATRPTVPIDPGQIPGIGTLPINPGIGTLPIQPTNPGIGILPAPGGGVIVGGGGVVIGGATPTGRIVADAGILVGTTSQASAFASNQVAAAPGAGGTVTTTTTTYSWNITGGRIVGSTTAATVDYIADTAGTVTLSVAITAAGVTSTASSTITAISGANVGAVTAPATAAASAGPNPPTITASVPAAQNGDRTFRWTVTGDAVITAGQNSATATIRPGSPGLKELTCEVTLQRLVTVPLRSYLVVNGDGPPTSVTINNGSGGGTYNANSRVDIFANPPPAGQVFDRWIGDTAAFGANAPLAPFVARNLITVPAAPITLTATYKVVPPWSLSTLANFNPQSQPAVTTGAQPSAATTLSSTLTYYLPPDASALVFLVHDTGSSAAAWLNSPEGTILTRDLVAAGYGVAALTSVNRTPGTWATPTTLAANLDALNHVAALNRFIQLGLPAATKPIFFLGYGAGAEAAVNYANLLATATPARPVLGAVLYCSSGSESLATLSKVPQFFALAANDATLGTAGNAAARGNVQLLAGRGFAAASVTNTVSPVHRGRFRALRLTSESFTDADADAVWSSLKTAGLLDANNYLKAMPTTAALTAALPEAHRARVAEVAAQLGVASASREFFSDVNARVIAFLNARLAGTPAPAPGRIVNLSTRAVIGYVGDSFSFGFNLGGGTARATLLIRGVGPALTRFGISGAIGAPRLEVHDSAGRLIASNDRWDAPDGTVTVAQISTATAAVGAFALAPGSLDTAVLLPNLAPGSYTATLKGINGSTGEVLAEVYDVTKNATRLTNLSTLAKIAEDGAVLTPGIVIQGANPRTLVVRAIGPGLADFGLPAAAILSDPRISVLNAAGATLETNNNWTLGDVTTLSAVFPAAGAFPLKLTNAADAALVTAVNAGAYTLQAGAAPSLAGALGAANINAVGSVLVEIYEVP